MAFLRRMWGMALVAVTVTLPPAAGAVSVALLPLAWMVPAEAVQVTEVLVAFVTVAVNCWVSPAPTVAVPGETETVTAGGGGGGGGETGPSPPHAASRRLGSNQAFRRRQTSEIVIMAPGD